MYSADCIYKTFWTSNLKIMSIIFSHSLAYHIPVDLAEKKFAKWPAGQTVLCNMLINHVHAHCMEVGSTNTIT